jgi:hypothetical protein
MEIVCYSPRSSPPLTESWANAIERNGGFFMGVTRPPLEYLATASKVALESFELSRLNEASNYRKEVQQILQGWIDTEVDARLARWILESKQAQARDGLQAAMGQPVQLKQLDLSFLPSNDAQESDGEAREGAAAEENMRKTGGPKLRRAAQPVLPYADGRTPEETQKSFGMKGAKLLEKRVGGGSLSGSAAAFSVRKPPFAQDEEDALHELQYFVERKFAAASRARPRNLPAEKDCGVPGRRLRLAGHARRDMSEHFAEVRVFPSKYAMPATACRAYASRAQSISVLERAMPAAAADRAEDSRARLNVRTLICRPGPERSRCKAVQPRAACARRAAPGF